MRQQTSPFTWKAASLAAAALLATTAFAGAQTRSFVDAGTVSREESTPSTSPDLVTATSYPFTVTTATLEDMTGSTQLVASGQDDTVSAVTSIGFDFWFDGVRYSQFSVNANGLMRLGSTAVATAFSNALAGTAGDPKIAAWWDDMTTGSDGKVHFKVVGTGNNRKLVVEWKVNTRTGTTSVTTATDKTYQVWLFESAGATTPGAIQFVYGSITSASGGTPSYSTGIASSTTSFASVTTSADTVSYSAANDNNATLITAGKSYIFTPPLPNGSPSGLTVTNPTSTSLRLNFTDNSSNEVGFPIYFSTDNVTFTFFGQLGANAAGGATAVTLNGLAPNTIYYFRVYSVTEGALSPSFTSASGTTNPPVSGSKTIGPGGDYTTFTAAINDANAGTGSGGVVFNVTAGATFTEATPCITGGSSTNPIVFQKSGAGTNPIIRNPGSTSTQDAGICILGGDYITVNGIDMGVAAGVTTVEYGYLVFNSSATNGAQNNTIQNSKITLDRANTSSVGIIQTLSVAATAASGANSNNKYYNITVENAYRGIFLNGTSATFPDSNNEIGVIDGGTTTIGGAAANDIGNGTVQSWGIRAPINQALRSSTPKFATSR
jgi:hypothetical protein